MVKKCPCFRRSQAEGQAAAKKIELEMAEKYAESQAAVRGPQEEPSRSVTDSARARAHRYCSI